MISHRALVDLEFDVILNQVKRFTLSEEGKKELQEDLFVFDAENLLWRQQIIEDFLLLRGSEKQPPSGFVPLASIVQELHIHKGRLTGKQLYDIGLYLTSAQTFIEYCHQDRVSNEPQGPASDLIEPLDAELKRVMEKINTTLQAPGEVQPTHPTLVRLYRDIEAKRRERQKFSTAFLRAEGQTETFEEGMFKDGRVVLPLRSDRKAQVDAIVHSTSSSGATLFVEPYRLVELNNQVVMAQQLIHIEIARILGELSAMVVQVLKSLEALMKAISRCDAYYARSRWVEHNG